jgi:hypothetical protein
MKATTPSSHHFHLSIERPLAIMRTSKFVHNADELPKGEHWAIIEGTSVTIPGDERSRTAPGHGYPEHSENYITYESFTNKEEFEAELKRRLSNTSMWQRPVRGIHVQVYEATTEIHLKEK